MKIAILGLGTVGSGVYEIINNHAFQATNNIEIKKILVRTPQKSYETNNIDDIIFDEEIDLIVECMGGLNPTHEYIVKALKNKKHVVTANKAVAAKYLDEFVDYARFNDVEFLFEASVGGGIPWLINVEKVRRIDDINKIYGIFNGTSNYILDDMYRNDREFSFSLLEAQNLGYAESDPSADIDGDDVLNKIILSSAVAFDNLIKEANFPVFSMRNITKEDISYLKNKKLAVKYIGEVTTSSTQYEASVMLNIFKETSQEASTPSNFNIATLEGNTIGELKFYGQGAGKLPTANAIVQDILDIKNKVKRKHLNFNNSLRYCNNLFNNTYLLRSTDEIEDDNIKEIEIFKGKFYYQTKEITTEELEKLISKFEDKDILIAKFNL